MNAFWQTGQVSNLMQSDSTRRKRWVLWLAVVTLAECFTAVGWAGPMTLVPIAGRPAGPTDQDLEPAVKKLREGRIDEALVLIRQLTAKHPEWTPAPLILSRLLISGGQAVPGRRALERAATEFPDHPEVYLASGALALGEGRYSDARLNFDAALGLTGSGKWDAEHAGFYRREALSGLAAVAEAREDWETARRKLVAVLELEPQNGQVRQRLGAVLFRLDKQEEAFETLKQAVQDTPALEPAAVTMGRLMTQKGNARKAEEWFDHALKLEPSSVRVRAARASWLLDQGRAQAARAEIEEAVKLDPAAREARRLQGLVAWHLRDLAAAETILDPLYREAPTELATADLLALCLVDQDDAVKRARGLQLAEANARQSPRSHQAIATLGWAHYRSGHLDQAEKLLRAAVQGVSVSPDIAYYLARVLADKGQSADARKLLQSASALTGAFAHRDVAIALLKSLPQ